LNEFDITAFGGSGDGIFDNTSSFTAAMLEIWEKGGGTLRIGQGIWKTGPFEIFSNITLMLDEGAVISFIPCPELYFPVWSRWEGVECYAMHPCLFASGQENISVKGKGIIDGSGEKWWEMYHKKRKTDKKNRQHLKKSPWQN